MMGRRDRDQASLFYDFNLDDVIPENHLLRRLDVFCYDSTGRSARAVATLL